MTKLATSSDTVNLPSVSLVTPSFNQAVFLDKTISSVLGQEYPALEYCVQDSCSTDGSADVLAAYEGLSVKIRIERDGGQADALNRGFADTCGEIMGYLNSDDLFLPGMLLRVGTYFRDHPDVDVIYGNRLIVDKDGHEIGRWILPGHDDDLLRFVDYVPQESMFWRRRIWNKAGARFDHRLQFAMDWELILRFADVGAVFRHVPELLGVFRVHGEQKSQADFATCGALEMSDLRRRHGGAAMGRYNQWVRHARYLFAHRLADTAFEKSL